MHFVYMYGILKQWYVHHLSIVSPSLEDLKLPCSIHRTLLTALRTEPSTITTTCPHPTPVPHRRLEIPPIYTLEISTWKLQENLYKPYFLLSCLLLITWTVVDTLLGSSLPINLFWEVCCVEWFCDIPLAQLPGCLSLRTVTLTPVSSQF